MACNAVRDSLICQREEHDDNRHESQSGPTMLVENHDEQGSFLGLSEVPTMVVWYDIKEEGV